MRIIDLFPPIAAGALIAAVWALMTYRIVKRDAPGNESWLQILWFLASIIPGGLYLIIHAKTPVGYFGVMMATLFALGLAGAMVFVVSCIILNRSLPRYPRVFFGACIVILVAGITVLPNL